MPLSLYLRLLFRWELVPIKDHNWDDSMVLQQSDPCHAVLDVPIESLRLSKIIQGRLSDAVTKSEHQVSGYLPPSNANRSRQATMSSARCSPVCYNSGHASYLSVGIPSHNSRGQE